MGNRTLGRKPPRRYLSFASSGLYSLRRFTPGVYLDFVHPFLRLWSAAVFGAAKRESRHLIIGEPIQRTEFKAREGNTRYLYSAMLKKSTIKKLWCRLLLCFEQDASAKKCAAFEWRENLFPL